MVICVSAIVGLIINTFRKKKEPTLLDDVAQFIDSLPATIAHRREKKAQKKAAEQALSLQLMGLPAEICPDCKGVKEVNGAICPKCNGAGLVKTQ